MNLKNKQHLASIDNQPINSLDRNSAPFYVNFSDIGV